MLKKNNHFIAFLLITFTYNAYNMEPIEPQKEYASFPLGDLPPEIQYHIVQLLSISKTIKEAGKAINAFAQTSQELYQLINDPQICLKIIKNISQQFNCSDQEAAKALQILEAKKRLEVQMKFWNLCNQEDSTEEEFNFLYTTYKEYVDLDFTYSFFDKSLRKYDATLLMYEARLPFNHSIIPTLLKHEANINKANSNGNTVLMIVAYHNKIETVQYLLSYPNIAVNQQNKQGETALIDAIVAENQSIIELLLDAGANPKIANNNGLTPLELAEQMGDQEIIKLLKDAIARQHGEK